MLYSIITTYAVCTANTRTATCDEVLNVLTMFLVRFDMGSLLPDSSKWRLAVSGKDFAVWESTKVRTNVDKRGDAKETVPTDIPTDIPKSSLHHLQSSHELKLSGKMSCKTVRRILNEVPNLVQTDDKSDEVLDDCNITHPDSTSPSKSS